MSALTVSGHNAGYSARTIVAILATCTADALVAYVTSRPSDSTKATTGSSLVENSPLPSRFAAKRRIIGRTSFRLA